MVISVSGTKTSGKKSSSCLKEQKLDICGVATKIFPRTTSKIDNENVSAQGFSASEKISEISSLSPLHRFFKIPASYFRL